MKCRVRIVKTQLDYFRSKARESNLEIQAMLVGRVVSPDLTVVERIVYPKQYHTQLPGNVSWFKDEYDKVREEAEEKGQRIVGDIHSHPNWWPVMSECDHRNHLEDGQRITGICATMKRKTQVYFWVAESSLPCIIEYAEQKRRLDNKKPVA
jgi:proteasome lid subunit RPN8/RPN11